MSNDHPHPIRLVADAAREDRIGGIRAWREETGNAIGIYLTAEQYQRDIDRAYLLGLDHGWWRGIVLAVSLCIIAAGTWIACWWVAYGGVK